MYVIDMELEAIFTVYYCIIITGLECRSTTEVVQPYCINTNELFLLSIQIPVVERLSAVADD